MKHFGQILAVFFHFNTITITTIIEKKEKSKGTEREKFCFAQLVGVSLLSTRFKIYFLERPWKKFKTSAATIKPAWGPPSSSYFHPIQTEISPEKKSKLRKKKKSNCWCQGAHCSETHRHSKDWNEVFLSYQRTDKRLFQHNAKGCLPFTVSYYLAVWFIDYIEHFFVLLDVKKNKNKIKAKFFALWLLNLSVPPHTVVIVPSSCRTLMVHY